MGTTTQVECDSSKLPYKPAQPSKGQFQLVANFRAMRFSLMEFSGGLGDLGTFIPLSIVLALGTGMNLGVILLFAGVCHIINGFVFGLPVPVQPMKAIVAVAVADQLLPADVAAAGIIVGATFFLLGVTGLTHQLDRHIPKSLIRGLQLGIGIKLALKGADYVTVVNGYWVIVILAMAGLLMLMLWRRLNRIPFILLLMIAGFIITLIRSESSSLWLGGMPPLSIVDFDATSWLNGLTYAAIPQIPLTLLNSVIAVSALSGDLFPGRKISTAKMSSSVGLINLTFSWFGAMPMCHGSGGLAAHYRFGAHTGGAIVMLGILEIVVVILFGNSITHLLSAFPHAIFGIMLILASVELIRPMRDQRSWKELLVAIVTAVGIILTNTAVGFLLGMISYGVTAVLCGKHQRFLKYRDSEDFP